MWEQHEGGREVKGQGAKGRASGAQPLATEKIWTPYEDSGMRATTAEVSSCNRDRVGVGPNVLTAWPVPEVREPLA